ncbi:MAG TPA: ABC transporter ATP-binding protein, partial [Chloroflexota bacterium]|nr:ABC transporter ATP-binding protein [Chloroflexota bacterium]
VQLLAMLGVLASFQPALVLIALALALPNLIRQFRQQADKYALTRWSIPKVRKMRYFGEVITWKDSARELRLFSLGDYFLQRFLEEFRSFHQRFHHLRIRYFRWEVATAVVTTLGNWTLYLYLVFLALGRRITLGDLTLYTQAIWQTHARVVDLVRQLSNLYGDILFVSQLFEFLDTPPVLASRPPSEALPPPTGLRQGIEFRNVNFAYPGTERPILEHLNLRIAPGECVALVGENGAGKTTIVKLLGRLYDPTEGQILVDGTDLRDLDLDQWRVHIATIFQDFSRYHLPAATNIGLGYLPKLEDRAAIHSAAERGGATAVVERLPEGYDTILGRWMSQVVQEGAELSGGEWQKIALSRAFMRSGEVAFSPTRDPSWTPLSPSPSPTSGEGDEGGAGAQLLILDEPTAALDTQSEYDVYLRFHELTRGKATLLISHRFSTVKMADRIVVLENGRTIEEGSHADLMALGGTYADLYEKQASRYR